MSEFKRYFFNGGPGNIYTRRVQPGGGVKGCEQDRRNGLINRGKPAGVVKKCGADGCSYHLNRVCLFMAKKRDEARAALDDEIDPDLLDNLI